jgi:hypothetical protein
LNFENGTKQEESFPMFKKVGHSLLQQKYLFEMDALFRGMRGILGAFDLANI